MIVILIQSYLSIEEVDQIAIFMKDNILELWGTKFILVLVKLPIPCKYMETIHNETNKSMFSVLFMYNTKLICCSFSSYSFSHNISSLDS